MKNINVIELHRELNSEWTGKILIDVREVWEFDMGSIHNSINIPLRSLAEHTEDLRKYHTVYVVCASGNRSKIACQFLTEHNIVNALNIEGGYVAWRRNNLSHPKL